MSTLVTLNASDTLADSRSTINDNFSTLNTDKVETLSDLSITATAAELNYCDGVTSNIQTQIDAIPVLPTGVILPYAATTAPSGWSLCDGSAISRTTYATLYALVGTTFGVGDGSTTFNLPDLRGRVIGALDNLGGSSANRVTSANADSLGGVYGTETHTLTEAEMPAHTHTYPSDNGSGSIGATTGAHTVTTGNSTGSTGGGGAHNNVQPTMFLGYIIKL